AVDGHEVALAIVVHAEVPSENDAAAIGVFLPQRSIAQDPETTVGMHVEQLSCDTAIIRRVGNARLIPTVQFKRVVNGLRSGGNDLHLFHGRSAGGGRHLLGRFALGSRDGFGLNAGPRSGAAAAAGAAGAAASAVAAATAI